MVGRKQIEAGFGVAGSDVLDSTVKRRWQTRTHAGVDHENGEDGQNPAPAEGLERVVGLVEAVRVGRRSAGLGFLPHRVTRLCLVAVW